MKRYLIFYCLVFISVFAFGQNTEPRVYSPYDGYDPLPEAYLFGDNVKLRTQPNPDSEVLELLKLGTKIEILQKTEEKMNFNGMESFWYKVKVEDKIGFLLQGLISLEKLSHQKTDYFFALRRENNEAFLKIRYRTNDSTYVEKESTLENDVFSLEISDNRGLVDVNHILKVNYISEACMMEGGGQYYFSDGKQLIKALEYSEIADGGIFWFYEQLIFPNEEDGVPNKLVYKRNLGNFMEEDDPNSSYWTEEKVVTRVFSWKNNAFQPDLEKFRQKLDKDE
jgi:hypothetical protein